MRFWFLQLLALILLGGSIFFFLQSVEFAADRNYAAAVIALAIGGLIVTTGRDIARLAFLQRG